MSGPWPVTQVVILEPHNLAVVVTPMDVFLMLASELYGQLSA